jgi:hypothetical protein
MFFMFTNSLRQVANIHIGVFVQRLASNFLAKNLIRLYKWVTLSIVLVLSV